MSDNNVYSDFPAIMQDGGRLFTDFTDRVTKYDIDKLNSGFIRDDDYRNWLETQTPKMQNESSNSQTQCVFFKHPYIVSPVEFLEQYRDYQEHYDKVNGSDCGSKPLKTYSDFI